MGIFPLILPVAFDAPPILIGNAIDSTPAARFNPKLNQSPFWYAWAAFIAAWLAKYAVTKADADTDKAIAVLQGNKVPIVSKEVIFKGN